MTMFSPSTDRRNSAVFRSSPLKPRAGKRIALAEIVMDLTPVVDRKGSLRTLFASGSAAMALEEAMDAQAAEEMVQHQPSPARRLLEAFKSSPRGPAASPRAGGSRPASPILSQSPSTASLLLQNAISRPASPVSRPSSPCSVYSNASVQSERPAFELYQDPEESAALDATVVLDDDFREPASESNDKENAPPTLPRRGSEASLAIVAPSAPLIEGTRMRIPVSYSTTDLPGAIGDCVRAESKKLTGTSETRAKRSAGDASPITRPSKLIKLGS